MAAVILILILAAGALALWRFARNPKETDPMTTTIPTSTLKLGSVGADVRTLQDLMNKNGYKQPISAGALLYGKPLTVDGIFGASTDIAVKFFQGKYGMVFNKPGVVDSDLWRKLYADLANPFI